VTTVTIGLPVFNGQRFLRACLDSLLAQSFADFDLIVSDNASTDATPAIIDEYARRDPRIRVERSATNQGAVWNHRRVLALAHGRYFKWCGADDACHPDFLRMCMDALAENPDAVLAYAMTEVIDEGGAPLARTSERLPLGSPDVVQRFTALMSAISVTQNPYYGLMRRASLEQVQPMGTFLASDRCLLGQLALLGPFVEVPAFLMYRRQHAGNQRTHTEDQRFLHPGVQDRFRTREWRVLREHLGAIARAPVRLSTKVRLLTGIAKWVVRQRGDLAAEVRALLRPRRRFA